MYGDLLALLSPAGRQDLEDSLQDEALVAMVPGLAELSGQSMEQLDLAARSPKGSLGRTWLLRMADGYVKEACQATGRYVSWGQALAWHRAKRAAQ